MERRGNNNVFKMEYKYINKILEKLWKMYHIQNGVIAQNYQIEFRITATIACDDEI